MDDNATILVVDDQPNNIKVLLSFFKKHNFQTRIADSGERALQMLDRFTPDLVLLDVMMPGLNGFETCQRIKADEEKRDIPIIFMTALDSIEDKLTGFEAGGLDYITKPFNQAEVLARINTHIALRRKSIELEKALREIKTLRGIIPICSNCKSIRDDEGYWEQLESYVRKHSDAKFSHGICPDCARKLYGDKEWFKDKKLDFLR